MTAPADASGRVVLIVTSPRLPAGLLAWPAWAAIDAADQVVAASADDALAVAVAAYGFEVTTSKQVDLDDRAREVLAAAARGSTVVWLAGVDGDPGWAEALAAAASRDPAPPPIEVLLGSWDFPGARVLDAISVMDRLRGPGGCPWDAEQTHESLAPYGVEEMHELVDAIASGDSAGIEEELGDVLLQVVFHAAVAREAPTGAFDIDDVAGRLVEKLIRRHPHVFADGKASTPAEVEAAWAAIKAEERGLGEAADLSLTSGIPVSLPAMARATQILRRRKRLGGPALAASDEQSLGARLLALIDAGVRNGADPEVELRRAISALVADADPQRVASTGAEANR